jgi:prephenate dehydrogenase
MNLPLESCRTHTENPLVHWKKISLIGVGLLGGSLGLAARRRMLADQVVGFVRRQASVRECEKAGAVNLATRDLEEAVSGSDLIVFCTPIAQMRPLLEQMLPWLESDAIITDVGSVKGSVVRDFETLAARAGARFVGSHPMAGSEKTGVRAARADLFQGALCVVTPTRKSDPAAVRKIEQLWKAIGSRLLRLSPEQHDLLVSRSSHLPHLLAATLANFVLQPKSPRQQLLLCANGFRDTTRIASGSPEMWRDIALSNGKHIGKALGAFIGELRRLQVYISQGDSRRLEALLTQAKTRRDNWRKAALTLSPE